MPFFNLCSLSYPKVARLLMATSLLALSACAGNVSRPIAEEDRDTEGRFDGRWVAKVDGRAGAQKVENWTFNCRAVKFDWNFEVRDGVATIYSRPDRNSEKLQVNTGFVSKAGRFRVEMPENSVAKASGGSDSRISDGAITLIFEGDLSEDQLRGYYVVGIRQFLNRGCRQYAEYEQLGK